MADRATAPISFDSQQASGLDQLAGAPPLMANSLTDIANVRKARPGIAEWDRFPATIPNASAVIGMAALGSTLIWVTEDRTAWAIDSLGAVVALSDATPDSRLEGSLRPQALSLRTQVIFAGGGVPLATNGVVTPAAVLGGSPPSSVGVTGIATRVVLSPNDTSGTFQWSGLGDSGHATWDPLNYAEAEAKPDPVANIATNTNELFVFGTQTLQVYSPDAVTDFAPGRALNLGLLAPYSLTEVDDQFAFLDRERRFVLTDGRSFSDEGSVLSKPIESVLRDLSAVSDCWGFRMRTGRWDAPVWFFPTSGRGFIWNRRNRGWSEWRAWGSTGWTTPNITSAFYWPEQNVFLVGLATGQIAKLDADATTDLGAPIKVELISGFDDCGTQYAKKWVSAKFVFLRGQSAQSATEPTVAISYRDDTGPYSAPRQMGLGLAGNYESTIELRSIGVSRRRQWRLEYTADANFTLIKAAVDFEVLNN